MRKYLASVLLLFCFWLTEPAMAQGSSQLEKVEKKRDRSQRKEERLRKKAAKKERKLQRREKKTNRREKKVDKEQRKLEHEQENRADTTRSQVAYFRKEAPANGSSL